MSDEHFHLHLDLCVPQDERGRVSRQLDDILTLLHKQGRDIMAELDDLTTQVKANTDVEASAAVLITGLSAKLDAAIASGNPAALTALSAELKSSSDALSAAVLANTPAATPTA